MINEAPYPLPIRVILPSLTSTDANAITPVITASPMEAPYPPIRTSINVTVQMPGGTNKPGYSWGGILQVLTVPNSTATGGGATGATIIEGVAKIISITAAPHVTTIWDYLLPIAIVAIIVVAAGILVARRKGMLGGRAVARRAAVSTRTARSKGGARSRKARPRRKASRRRKAGGGRARARRSGARRRRRR